MAPGVWESYELEEYSLVDCTEHFHLTNSSRKNPYLCLLWIQVFINLSRPSVRLGYRPDSQNPSPPHPPPLSPLSSPPPPQTSSVITPTHTHLSFPATLSSSKKELCDFPLLSLPISLFLSLFRSHPLSLSLTIFLSVSTCSPAFSPPAKTTIPSSWKVQLNITHRQTADIW